ncbi:MAG: hypothetical protein ACFFBI_09070 [Promethearchaeota archaeon]
MKNIIKKEIFLVTLSFLLGFSVLNFTNYQGNLKADKTPILSQGIYTMAQVSDHLWSPDGTQVAYIKSPNGERFNCELWVADISPSGLINHFLVSAEAEYDGLLDWKDDWILFRIRHEFEAPASYYGRNELWKIRADGTDITQITFTYSNGIRTEWWNHVYDNRGTAFYGWFIPETDLVYFTAHDGNGWYMSFVCNDDGTDNWQHRSNPYMAFTVPLTPTGDKLLWGHASYWNAPTTLWASEVDGTDKHIIKAFSIRIWPLVLADWNTIIYHDPPPGDDIWAINMDGTIEWRVTNDNFINYWGNYNPLDEQGLLMRSNRDPDGNMHIFKIKVDGTEIEQLTGGPYMDESPILSPNGHYLSYLRLPYDFVKEGSSIPYPYELVIKNLVVHATVDFNPETLNQKSKGKWVTVYIGLPDEYDVNDIDIDSIRLDGLSRADSSPTEISDDGILMVKFDRAAVIDLLEPGENVLITITGVLSNGLLFEGTDTISVIH